MLSGSTRAFLRRSLVLKRLTLIIPSFFRCLPRCHSPRGEVPTLDLALVPAHGGPTALVCFLFLGCSQFFPCSGPLHVLSPLPNMSFRHHPMATAVFPSYLGVTPTGPWVL